MPEYDASKQAPVDGAGRIFGKLTTKQGTFNRTWSVQYRPYSQEGKLMSPDFKDSDYVTEAGAIQAAEQHGIRIERG